LDPWERCDAENGKMGQSEDKSLRATGVWPFKKTWVDLRLAI